MKGSPYLKLCNLLYWISFLTMTFNGYFFFPLSKQLQGGFPQNSIKGQICTKIDFHSEQMNSKQRIFGFFIPLVMTIFNLRFNHNISKYLKGQNLKMTTFSQFGGKHRRNIFTYVETSNYFFASTFFLILDHVVIVLFQQFSQHINKTTQFYIHNLLWFVFVDCFFGVFVPLKHLLQRGEVLHRLWLDEKSNQETAFFVRTPEIIPRRYEIENNITTEECGLQNVAKFSYLKKRLVSKANERPMSKNRREPMKHMKRTIHEIIIDPVTPISI